MLQECWYIAAMKKSSIRHVDMVVLDYKLDLHTRWCVCVCVYFSGFITKAKQVGYICTCKVPRCVRRTRDLPSCYVVAGFLDVSQTMVHRSKMGLLDKIGCPALCPHLILMNSYGISGLLRTIVSADL